MTSKLTISDFLSLSRIPLALLFVVSFSSTDLKFFIIASFITLLSLLTDVLDGKLARARNEVSIQGYMLDGLGDKAFYIALLVVAVREDYTSTMLAFFLITREVSLYALRVISYTSESLKSLRIFSTTHALFIRVYFLLFFIEVYFANQLEVENLWFQYFQLFGWIACISSYIGLYKQSKIMWKLPLS